MTKKLQRRISFFFRGGTAQVFTLDEGDKFVGADDGWTIQGASVDLPWLIHILADDVSYYRLQTFWVEELTEQEKMIKRQQLMSTTSGSGTLD